MKTSPQILFLTSYPPRECGIATYSQDLVRALHEKFSRSFQPAICAIENGESNRIYPAEVKYVLNTCGDIDNYIELSAKINDDADIKCLFVQHEFGLFSGEMGEHLIHLLLNVTKPVINTFHTALPNPNDITRLVVKTIASLSDKIIVMTHSSARLLQSWYGIDEDKIVVIPHGTHLLPWRSKGPEKNKNGFANRPILSVFGLLSSNKNIETTLNALPEIKKYFPDVLYLVLGKTHPGVVAHEGEQYREYLEAKVQELGIEDNVLFINKYLTQEELFNYLSLTDIYIFSSKDPNQAVSGTFAYALASGCPIVSTPIPHAKEVLNDGMGRFFDFGNHEQLANSVIQLLSDAGLRNQMSLNALHAVRASAWENVAVAHARLFSEYTIPKERLLYNYPQVSLKHLFALTSPRGIVQFSVLNQPDKSSGFTLDDNARALIALAMYYKTENVIRNEFAEVYLNFMEYCQQPDGTFLNYVDYDKTFNPKNETVNLEDSNGRAIWALGFYLSSCGTNDYRLTAKAKILLHRALKNLSQINSPRAVSFIIKGLYLYNEAHKNKEISHLINSLARKLMEKYYDAFEHNWEWFENYLTYANSVMPEAMLYAYLNSGEEMYKLIAKNSFDFLLLQLFNGKQIQVVSNDGWKHKNQKAKKFGEQPIDVAYTVMSLQLFHRVFHDDDYTTMADIAFSWFLGNNHLGQTIYDPTTGGCCDGLEEHNVNLNQGAESTICYLMARLAMEDAKKENYHPTILPVLAPPKHFTAIIMQKTVLKK